jgi:hypothetical protein
MSSIREQVAPDSYITTGVVVVYDSFAPAKVPAEASEAS